ncbi:MULTISPECIES: 3-phosphoshikimate 1-carboxyvinyltransferase [Sutcliffiella]|uniref:3-phosphoshikimate 1-carboxyvinyltransferase n=1 Tax=Sutcliffiella cohnii TaxID=33932 RepID=A0A223KRX7_9BACI|nr:MULTISPECIES: 3-phosphoshikimate 1-carboxyvinyltransferase [Sutcliffiella]AST92240.1 3-phosphoshikimate 1-carboxyvinyltransferase [Sutcliffiella cohnii]MED4017304.1 3-phosphoshikimate 1-carboxyvinyltransferase [Sutcliffiella cohnii]WBL13472.1 3-phosphoshikimate 1-carboxyvinyltransferase [Sutcliffiella sp. NC1]
MKELVTNVKNLRGEIDIPGDKSISHRAVMFSSIATGTTTVENFLEGEDCLSTIHCFRKLGVEIDQKGTEVTVHGKGLKGLVEPTEVLDVGNSGTTARLMMGLLAGQPFHSVVVGDESIAKRPMKRVTDPLRKMGANIHGRADANYTPISISGSDISNIEFHSPVASAQVKSALLLAALQGEGEMVIHEPAKSRDHTERMLQAFGCEIEETGNTVRLKGNQTLTGGIHITVPGDISSAAFFIVAALIVPNSKITLKKVGLNKTRTGIIDVVEQMGATVFYENKNVEGPEPYADLIVETSELHGIVIGGEIMPRLIDEIPIIALLATRAKGTTVIKDAEELKVKETNRIRTVVSELTKLGANITETDDGMVIVGNNTPLHGAEVNSYGDHRIGMMLAVAALIVEEGEVLLQNSEAISVSYPNFFDHLSNLIS